MTQEVYEIIYDYCSEYDGCYSEDYNIVETFEGSWTELQDYIKRMRANGCYNISATFLYNVEDDYA